MHPAGSGTTKFLPYLTVLIPHPKFQKCLVKSRTFKICVLTLPLFLLVLNITGPCHHHRLLTIQRPFKVKLGMSWRNGWDMLFFLGTCSQYGVFSYTVVCFFLGTCSRYKCIFLYSSVFLPWYLFSIQEYYANTGALQKAAASARGGSAPGVSIVEAFGKEVKPRELKDVLRIEYR